MDDSLILLALFGFFPLVFCGFTLIWLVAVFFMFRFASERTSQRRQAWAAFAQVHHLNFEPGSFIEHPTISGTYRNRPVTLSIFALTRHRHYTVAMTRLKPGSQAQLQISDRGQAGWYYRTMDGPTITVDGGRFSEKFEVKGTSPAFAQSLLSPATQAAILASGISHLAVASGELKLRYWGFETRPEVLKMLLDLVCQVADTVE